MAKKKIDTSSFINDDLAKLAGGSLFGDTKVKTDDSSVTEIELEKLVDYADHTYKVLENEDMEKLVDSIKTNGIIEPLIVRAKQDGTFEIISGHRRKFAASKAGLSTVPCYIKDIPQDAVADILMVDSNFYRENTLPSEKAFSYKKRRDAVIITGNLSQLFENVPDSKATVERYIRLTKLDKRFLDMVDAGAISLNAGVTLASLPITKQQKVIEYMAENNITEMSANTAERITKAATSGHFERLDGIFNSKSKAHKSSSGDSKFKFNIKFFLNDLPEDIKKASLEEQANYILKAVKAYKEN